VPVSNAQFKTHPQFRNSGRLDSPRSAFPIEHRSPHLSDARCAIALLAVFLAARSADRADQSAEIAERVRAAAIISVG
jgi:hypothetical protein